MAKPCRLIEISGAPFERGRQYGVQAEPEIKAGITHYAAQVRALGLGDRELAAVVEGYLPAINDFEPRYVEEMRGIAAGAGVEFHHVVMINARTEVLKLAINPGLREGLFGSVEPDGCTALVVAPSATADRRLIHAHNWDWKVASAEASVVLRIRRDDGPDILSFAEAGALSRFGFNALGIAITGNYLECDRDYTQVGVPLGLIRRRVLEQSHFALALQAAYATRKSGSNNIVVSHSGGGLIFNFECAPNETFLVEPRDGVLTHANHWQSPVALAKLQERGVLSTPDSLYRDRRLRQLVEDKIGALTVDHIKAALLDDWQSPWSICAPPRKSLQGNLDATVITLVMQAEIGLMEIAVLPALDPTFTRYSLEMEDAALSRGAV
jgi:isopenicillin-N N-acyltransferase-like protein